MNHLLTYLITFMMGKTISQVGLLRKQTKRVGFI